MSRCDRPAARRRRADFSISRLGRATVYRALDRNTVAEAPDLTLPRVDA
jgi:hypothetical protein